MFIGRNRELKTLNRLYNSGKFEFAVIYGRRRVGKTALINRFAQDKDAILFTGVESSAKQNLENLSNSIFDYSLGGAVGSSFDSFQKALEYVFELAKEKRIVLAIDEYPYVAKASPSLASTLQMLIDRYKDESGLMLILCGSSMSYMEDKVLAYKAPLYGRRTAQLKIGPLSFFEACEYLEGYSAQEKALLYGALGGTPQYLLQINRRLSVEDNIQNLFLTPSSFIYEEPGNLLKQEVREPAVYNAIISAIAGGASKMNEIATAAGEDTGACTTYIKNLISLGLLKKELPYGEKAGRKTLYSIEDNMFRFWYRFVPSNTSVIERGAADIAYARIEPELSSYMGAVFEDICKQYLWKLLMEGKSPVNFSGLGRWWGTDPRTRKQVEIDILGAGGTIGLLCECKWKNEKTDRDVLEKLLEKGELFGFKEKVFFLFSKSGFTEGCRQRASELGNVNLIPYQSIME